MYAYIFLSPLTGECLPLYIDSVGKGVTPVEINGVRFNALMAALLTAHGMGDIEIKRVSLGYDGSPVDMSYDLEFLRGPTFARLKQDNPEAWYIKIIG
jgi:hypothetical protein